MRTAVLAGAVALLVLGIASAQTPADVGIIGGQIRVPPGQTNSHQMTVLFATGAEMTTQPAQSAAKVTDLDGKAGGVTVTFGSGVKNIGISTGTDGKVTRYEWQAPVDIKGLPPNTSQTRNAEIDFGTAKRSFRYDVTNKTTPLTWTLNAPANAVAVSGANATLMFSVTLNGDGDPTRVVLSRMTLRDPANRVVPADAIVVQDKPISLGTPVPVKLTVKGACVPAGNYNGSVEIAAVGAAEAKTFDLAIASSPPRSRLIGFFCVLAGVILAFILSGILRNYSTRLTALMPAERLRTLIAAKKATLSNVGNDVGPETRNWLSSLQERLSSRELTRQNFIPWWIPLVYGSPVDTGDYTKYLQAVSDEFGNVSYLIGHGFVLVQVTNPDPAAKKWAYAELDTLARDQPANIRTKTDDIIQNLKPKVTEAMEEAAPPRAELTIEQMQVRIEVVAATAWILWAIISASVGYLAAVNVAGFGIMTDYLKAFLWGLGLQTAGTQLQTLTPSSIGSTIGVSIPKSGNS